VSNILDIELTIIPKILYLKKIFNKLNFLHGDPIPCNIKPIQTTVIFGVKPKNYEQPKNPKDIDSIKIPIKCCNLGAIFNLGIAKQVIIKLNPLIP
jgi:hypothetical protein